MMQSLVCIYLHPKWRLYGYYRDKESGKAGPENGRKKAVWMSFVLV